MDFSTHELKLRTPRARSVWLRINATGNEKISVSRLANQEQCSRSSIYRVLREIERAGLKREPALGGSPGLGGSLT